MGAERAKDVTELLAAWRAGDRSAPEALAGLVYADLRSMAARRLAGNARMPLQTTELVHEAFARLLETPLKAVDREHFFRTVALALRQVLTDAIRRDRAEKRGMARTLSCITEASAVMVDLAELTFVSSIKNSRAR